MSLELLKTNDAMVWAEEFVKTKELMGWSLEDIDEGLMVGWFANAMYAQEMAMFKKMETAQKSEMPTLEELERDGITVRKPTPKEIADEFLRDAMNKEKGNI